MRRRWAVLVSLCLATYLLGAPDLDSLGTAPSLGTGPAEIEVLPLPVDVKVEEKSPAAADFLGVSIPKALEPSDESMKSMKASEAQSALESETSTGLDDGLSKESLSVFSEPNEGKESLPLKEGTENEPLNFETASQERQEFEPMGKLVFLGFIATILGVVFLWVWYRKQIRGKIQPNARLPMQVLGQTWLDGQSKILTLRVGSKILIIAKSAQYCTTLDVISDPAEVNLITLGGGQRDDEFEEVLKASQLDVKDIPDAEGIQSDIKELKRQLGDLKGSS